VKYARHKDSFGFYWLLRPGLRFKITDTQIALYTGYTAWNI
jgi:hypothetical protein